MFSRGLLLFANSSPKPIPVLLTEITLFVAAAIKAPTSNNANPICATADPARRHLPLNASPRIFAFARIEKTAAYVRMMYIKLVYTFVIYTAAAVMNNDNTSEIAMLTKNFLASVFLYFKY